MTEQTPQGQIYIVKDAGLWRDAPESDRLTHLAITYGVVPENSKPYQGGMRAVVKFLHAGTEEEVHKRAEELAGKNRNGHIFEVPIGGWIPLHNNYQQYAKEVKIQQREGQEALRTVVSDEDKKAREEMKEIDDRRQALKEEEVTLEDTDTLEYYTMQRVKETEIERFVTEGEKRLEDAKKRLRDIKLRNADLREAHPEYEDLWEEELKKKRAAEGVGGEKPNIINERIE